MRQSREKYLLYVGVCLALIPVLLLRDFTPSNELRYLSIADEALRNHTLFAFTNHGEPYADKPPLYLWLIMLSKCLFGQYHMWFLSLFSLIPALGIVRVMDHWTRQDMDSECRSVARLMLLTSGLFTGVAIILRMDMLMCLFIVLALRSFWRLTTGNFPRERYLFPVYIFLAIFTKGPLGLLIPFCCSTAFLLLTHRGKQFFRYWGWRTWGILAALCAVWFGATYLEGGSGYLNELLFHQTIDRAIHSFHHEGPVYYYLISIWYSLAPWSLLAIGIILAVLRPKVVYSDLQRFFLTVIVTTFVLISVISAKLQVYMLPLLPFLIYGSMMFLPRFRPNNWMRAAVALPAVALALVLPTLVILASTTNLRHLDNGWFIAGAALLSISGVYALWQIYNKKEPQFITTAMRSMGIGVLCCVFVGGWGIPYLNKDISYRAVCERALEISKEKGISDFHVWGIRRAENMDVYLNRPVEVLPKDQVPSSPKEAPAILLLNKKDLKYLPADANAEIVGHYAVVVCTENDQLNSLTALHKEK